MSDKNIDIAISTASFITAIGITASTGEFLGGLFLAIATGTLLAVFIPDISWKERIATVFAALVFATLIAIFDDSLLSKLPLQGKMAIGGLIGRFAVLFLVQFQNTALEKSKDISEKIIDKVVDKVE